MKINFSEILREALLGESNWDSAKNPPEYKNNNVSKNFEIIKKAIDNLDVIDCYYYNAWGGMPKNQYARRLFEPFAIVQNSKGNLLVSGYFTNFFTKSNNVPFWRTYLIENFSKIRIVPRKNRPIRAGFNPNGFTGMRVLVSIMDKNKIVNKGGRKSEREVNPNYSTTNSKFGKNIDKPKFQEPTETTGEFEEDDLTQN